MDPAELARAIVDSNLYLVMGTADREGRPWVSPVYFAHIGYREFVWVSRPETTHSRNIEARRDVSIVVFDSSVPMYSAQAMYATAEAEELHGEEPAGAIAAFSERSQLHGGPAWTREQVEPPAHLRLYRATAVELYVLDPDDRRVPVAL